MRRPTCTVALLGVLALTACQPSAKKDALASSPQDVESGSTFTLNKAMVIPEGTAAVYFQDTQLVVARGLRPNYAYCKFELDGPATAARQVSPQSFWVTTVDYD